MRSGQESYLGIGSTILLLRAIPEKVDLKTFENIKNIDLIMEEQKLEERVNIAHLRINKQLFQIDMKDIRLKKIIGEGESNSVVYLVSWYGKDAAFKCFRTRSICSEQQNFDEFEKEVAILGSISHPNIIRYYGACLDPSRTGFVMEFCSNGDINYFITSKKRKQETIEFSEKIRMFRNCFRKKLFEQSGCV